MADPDLELRGRRGGGFVLLAMSALLPYVMSSYFTRNEGGRGGGRRDPGTPP